MHKILSKNIDILNTYFSIISNNVFPKPLTYSLYADLRTGLVFIAVTLNGQVLPQEDYLIRLHIFEKFDPMSHQEFLNLLETRLKQLAIFPN